MMVDGLRCLLISALIDVFKYVLFKFQNVRWSRETNPQPPNLQKSSGQNLQVSANVDKTFFFVTEGAAETKLERYPSSKAP